MAKASVPSCSPGWSDEWPQCAPCLPEGTRSPTSPRSPTKNTGLKRGAGLAEALTQRTEGVRRQGPARVLPRCPRTGRRGEEGALPEPSPQLCCFILRQGLAELPRMALKSGSSGLTSAAGIRRGHLGQTRKLSSRAAGHLCQPGTACAPPSPDPQPLLLKAGWFPQMAPSPSSLSFPKARGVPTAGHRLARPGLGRRLRGRVVPAGPAVTCTPGVPAPLPGPSPCRNRTRATWGSGSLWQWTAGHSCSVEGLSFSTPPSVPAS